MSMTPISTVNTGASESSGALSRRALLSRQRQAVRTRIHARVVRPIDTPRSIPDPLRRPVSRARTTLTSFRLLIAAVGAHLLILSVFTVLGRAMGSQPSRAAGERLTVHLVEPPKIEPPALEPAPVKEGPIEPDFAETPKTPEPPKAPPPKRIEPRPVQEAPPQELPAEAPPEAAPAADPGPRRIVGLSFESTVGGEGPAFAVGDTRRGKTAARAAEKRRVPPGSNASRKAARRNPAPQSSGQRAATRIPTRDVAFEKPVRLRPSKPAYPAKLRAQGIEGDVLVKVAINTVGKVTKVTVIGSSGHSAFDEVARRTAMRETFAPAKRDGKAVSFTLTYTYRFRLD